jgi:hypothetical protein
VSIESVNDDLARLERDVRNLSQDAGRLVDDVADQGRTIREEAIAAEFIATEETIESVGSILSALSELQDIHRKQLRVFFEDQRDTLKAITESRSPADLLRVGLDHWGRRASHVGEGIGATVNVLVHESSSLTNTLVEMWTPFVQLVRRDWAQR